MSNVNGVALAVLVVLFALVTVMGFYASRWRRPTSMESLDEWGSAAARSARGSRGSCSAATSTRPATFVVVPAAMFAAGSVSASSRCPTRSCSTRSSSSSWDGCGR